MERHAFPRKIFVTPADLRWVASTRPDKLWPSQEVTARSTSRSLLCPLAALSLIVGAPLSAQTTRPTIAVLNFEFGSIQQWWSGNQDIGTGISDMIVDKLIAAKSRLTTQ